MHFFREKLHLLNEQLSNAWSPLQLIVITAVITTFILSIYRFLFIHDEGKYELERLLYKTFLLLSVTI